MPTQYIRYFAPVAFALSIFACAYRTSLAQDPNQVEKNGKPAHISTAAEAIEALKSDAGTWEAAVTLWPRPDSVPITSHAVVNAKLDVGGKLLEQRCSGKFGPANENRDWTCLSYTNFYVSAGQFETVRMASSGSPMIIVRGKGKYDKKLGMSIELTGQYSLMGNHVTERDVLSHDGPDKCVIESWISVGGIKEFKTAEMVLTRVAQPVKTAVDPALQDAKLRFGNFSVSLAVKDLKISREFYEKLGFVGVFGNAKNYLIMQNDSSTIGLFQGMLDRNILTFNPGWDRTTATLPEFDDVRDIQQKLKDLGVALTTTADATTTGPASLTFVDPDGNQILIDQHVPRPKK